MARARQESVANRMHAVAGGRRTDTGRPRAFRFLALIGLAACAACAPSANVPEGASQPERVMAAARDALSRLDRSAPEPFPCGVEWAESPAGYVVALSEAAERDGLRRGDRIVAVGGTPVAGIEARDRAYRHLPATGPFVLGAMRREQHVALTMTCRSQPELFLAERRTLEAASRGDWGGCIASAREARRLAGYTGYLTLVREHACASAKRPAMGSIEEREFAALHHELHRLLLQESRYVPGGTANVRDTILRAVSDLRRMGLSASADDLEGRLQAALAAMPRLQLTWADNATNEHGFSVERRIGETGGYAHTATLPPNTTTYVDFAVQEGVTYCYRVKAFGASGTSDATNEACAKPAPPSSRSGETR